MTNLALIAALGSTLVLTAPASSSQTESLSFTLNNDTDYTLVALYISVPRTNDWEEDIFGADVLGSGESIEISVEDGLEDCVYDLKAEFSDGDDVILTRTDLCELDGGELTIE